MHTRILPHIFILASFGIGIVSAQSITPHLDRGEEQIVLRRDNGRMAILCSPGQRENMLAHGLPAVGMGPELLEAHAIADWVLVNLVEPNEKTVDALVERVAHMPGVEFATQVFLDDLDGAMFPTPKVLLAFVPNVTTSTRQALIKAHGLRTVQEYPALGVVLLQPLQVRKGMDLLAAANALAARPEVLMAEPDMVFTGRGGLVPSDPYFPQCWGLLNTGQLGGTPGIDMKATQAWDITQGDANILTVIIDTGVDQAHPDIHQVPGTDTTTDPSTDGGPVNEFDNHGTPVAGCVSATINNGIGTVGVAPGTRSASARTMIGTNSSGSWSSSASWTVASLNWAVSIGARVTNNSNYYGFTSAAIETAYTSTRNSGMVHFGSAGNDASNALSYPSSLNTVNAISAITRTGALSSFSNYNSGLSYCAPGSYILSTDRSGSAGYNTTSYAIMDGTSFASPYAAGVAALVLSVDPSLSALDVETILDTTATDLGPAGFDNFFGHGLVNAFAAVSAVARTKVAPRLYLEGPYDAATGLMNDAMRALSLVPDTEPYTDLGYAHLGGGNENTSSAVLSIAGSNAIVDWVLVELRDANTPTLTIATCSALLQRDGDIVDIDGVSPVSFDVLPGEYHLAVRHRNHLGCMTAGPVELSVVPLTIDFSLGTTATYGAEARKAVGGTFPVLALWAGDVTFDATIKYTGDGNDRDPILNAIGGVVPTNSIIGYHRCDVNMDGIVRYTGEDNDRDPLLQNIGGVVPTNTRAEQVP